MKISRTYKLFTFFIALLLTVTGLLSYLSLRIQRDTVRSERHRFRSFHLAHELLQSSEDLTRMARSYAATSDPVYETYYDTILDIRNGKRSRPVPYASTYWHLAGIGRGPAEATGETVALRDLLRREKFAAEELALLDDSQARSDHLVAMEEQAFAALKGLFDDGHGNLTVRRPPDPAFAVSLLFSEHYVDEKAAIMAPIQEFLVLIEKRTTAELLSHQLELRRQIRLTTALIAITLLAVFLKSLQTFRSVLAPLRRLLATVTDIASGHYAARCAVDSSNEVGELSARLNDMADALQTDIARREQAEGALQESLETIGGLLDGVDAGIVVVDPVTHVIEQVNPHAANLFGASQEDVRGRVCHDFLCPTEVGRCPITDLGKVDESRECTLRRVDGTSAHILKSVKTIRLGGHEKLLETFVDISKRKEAEEQIRYLATHDALTGLPVLQLARDLLLKSIHRSDRTGNMTAVLFLDLDGFKAVNDTLGHGSGDQVLEEVAGRLLSCVRKSDTVARIGGDEFLVIVDDVHDHEVASRIAETLVGVLSRPMTVDGHEARVGASVGIALYPADGQDLDELIKRADQAMYGVKKAGKNGVAFAAPPAGSSSAPSLQPGPRRM